jgi:hypothetical protein
VCGPGPQLCASQRPVCCLLQGVAYLTVDNVQNEVVTIHRTQEVSKMLSSLHVGIFRNELFC